MLIWLTFALLAAVVATLLLHAPRQSNGAGAERAHDPDAAVYRDQLAELEADQARGVLSETEVASARTEIARRLLKHSGDGTSLPAPSTRKPPVSGLATDKVLLGAVTAIPLLGLGLYLAVGRPDLPGRPFVERLNATPETATAQDLIAKVEQRLRENPGDGMGWQVIAPVYIGQGRFAEAGMAYERAIKLLGETPERVMGLAKALVLANNGMVVPPARAAYSRVLQLDSNRAEAKFWLAIADEQSGKTAEAVSAFRKMLAEAPSDAPWREAVEARLQSLLAKVDGVSPPADAGSPSLAIPGAASSTAPGALASGPSGGMAVGTGAPGGMSAPVLAPASGPKPPGAGPTPAEFVAAAEKLPVEMRDMMLGRMISRATEAVKSAPQDAAAWSRIITGYKALGKTAEAAEALKQARAALSGDQAAQTELDALAKSLGLPA